jgi:hypothetical protein
MDGYKKCTAVWLGVIYDSQLAGIHENTNRNRWMLLLLIEKSPKVTFLYIKTFDTI